MYLDDENFDEDDINDSEFLHKNNSKNKGNKICEIFSLYGNMDQHKRAEILGKYSNFY
jgi:hypothetical protein